MQRARNPMIVLSIPRRALWMFIYWLKTHTAPRSSARAWWQALLWCFATTFSQTYFLILVYPVFQTASLVTHCLTLNPPENYLKGTSCLWSAQPREHYFREQAVPWIVSAGNLVLVTGGMLLYMAPLYGFWLNNALLHDKPYVIQLTTESDYLAEVIL